MKPAEVPPFRQARLCECGEHGFVGLTRGLVSLVSPVDVPMVARTTWYAVRGIAGFYAVAKGTHLGGDSRQIVQLHRFLTGAVTPHVDHRSSDTLDNQRDNLRPCSAKENVRRRRKAKGCMVPYKGVSVQRRQFQAKIVVDGRYLYLGLHPTLEAAARAYDAAALEHFGDFALTNQMLGLLPAA